MSMDPVKRLSSTDRTATTGPATRNRKSDERTSAPGEAADRLDLSDAARASFQAARAPESNPPAKDADRSGEIKQRIQQGYYQREDVVGSIVDALLKSFHQE